jgi:hypothetical protein
MENTNSKFTKTCLISTLLYLLADEICHFIRLGGLENPLAKSLFKISAFMFIFLFTFRNLSLFEFDRLQYTLLKLVDELRSSRDAKN